MIDAPHLILIKLVMIHIIHIGHMTVNL